MSFQEGISETLSVPGLLLWNPHLTAGGLNTSMQRQQKSVCQTPRSEVVGALYLDSGLSKDLHPLGGRQEPPTTPDVLTPKTTITGPLSEGPVLVPPPSDSTLFPVSPEPVTPSGISPSVSSVTKGTCPLQGKVRITGPPEPLHLFSLPVVPMLRVE